MAEEAGQNYEIARSRLELGSWSEEVDGWRWVERPPTNAEILKLLDALHADIKGETTRETDEALRDRWWNS